MGVWAAHGVQKQGLNAAIADLPKSAAAPVTHRAHTHLTSRTSPRLMYRRYAEKSGPSAPLPPLLSGTTSPVLKSLRNAPLDFKNEMGRTVRKPATFPRNPRCSSGISTSAVLSRLTSETGAADAMRSRLLTKHHLHHAPTPHQSTHMHAVRVPPWIWFILQAVASCWLSQR